MKKASCWSVVLAAISLLALSAPAGTEQPAAPQKTGEIRGTLAYCGPGGNSGIGIFIPGRSFQATVGANGQFVLNFVPAGTYNLTVEIPGHAADQLPDVIVADNKITELGEIAICRDSDSDNFTEDVDCNDNNPMVHPLATEGCDGFDNNCNSMVDEGCALCTDADQDGFYAQAGCLTQKDCNDGSATVRPNASEVCDSVDNNCNTATDEGFDLTSDTSNCGACGNVCSFANASATCASGDCQFGSCLTGYTDCNQTATDGCEINTNSDLANCGACGNACPSTRVICGFHSCNCDLLGCESCPTFCTLPGRCINGGCS